MKYITYALIGLFCLILISENIIYGLYFIYHLIAFVFFYYVLVCLHEFGHALAGRLVGINIKKIIIGTGRTLFKRDFLGTTFIITTNLNGGYTLPYKVGNSFVRLRYAIFTAGGIFVHIFLIVFWAFYYGFQPFLSFSIESFNLSIVFFISNLYLLILTIIPMNFSYYGLKLPNDGLRLLKMPFLNIKGIEELYVIGIVNEAMGYFDDKDFEAAERILRQYNDKFKNQPLIQINLSASLIKLLRFDEAIKILENLEAEENDKKYDFIIFNNLAWAYLLRDYPNSIKKAEVLSEKAYELKPKVPFVRRTYGAILIELGKLDKGLQLLKKSSKLGKRIDDRINHPVGYLFVAYAYLKKGEKEKMIQYLTKLETYSDKHDLDFNHVFNILKNKTNGFDNYYSFGI